MTRRITLVMVAVVAATLLIAGLITVVVTQARATRRPRTASSASSTS